MLTNPEDFQFELGIIYTSHFVVNLRKSAPQEPVNAIQVFRLDYDRVCYRLSLLAFHFAPS